MTGESSATMGWHPNQRSFTPSAAFSQSSSLRKSLDEEKINAIYRPVELDVNIADEMITEILTNIHLFDFAVFVFDLEENLFVELIVMLLKHGFGDLLAWKGRIRFIR